MTTGSFFKPPRSITPYLSSTLSLMEIGIFNLVIILTVAQSSLELQRWSRSTTDDFCQNPNRISIAGRASIRMVPEGGRIVLICCNLGNTSGHDHEQLLWTGPSQKPIINYFSNSIQAAQSRKYAVPDFSDKSHIGTKWGLMNNHTIKLRLESPEANLQGCCIFRT
ncbi:hypothetical protein TcWFU_008237 [Taenia crassiceps]|uniref:Ig-like domain-containing protein n=1 Tax=Taenia crassiceps TaxID=6207 RepID=A0ABR4Q9R2_9CEST